MVNKTNNKKKERYNVKTSEWELNDYGLGRHLKQQDYVINEYKSTIFLCRLFD